MNHLHLRKYIIEVLVLALLGILSACANNTASPKQTPQPSQMNNSQEDVDEIAVTNEIEIQSKTSNILIAYFAVAENSEVDAVSSASVRVINGEAKGNIRVLADVIQSNVVGDMFSILTSVKYPAGIMELIDFADKEQEEN